MERKLFENIRTEYAKRKLDESSVNPDPFIQFTLWFEEVIQAGIEEPSAMFLATSGTDGRPSGRIVLLKGINEKGFIFFTNYDSLKGREIRENPNVAITFHWKELERQVRITGEACRLTKKESDAYFKSRPFESRVSAAISPQSSVIPGRDFLEERRGKLLKHLDDKKITRPLNWGGFIVKPVQFEFWQGRESRLHDRIQFRLEKKNWIIERLAP
jgi:pyridoxamine 5'-phosphate oxidase